MINGFASFVNLPILACLRRIINYMFTFDFYI